KRSVTSLPFPGTMAWSRSSSWKRCGAPAHAQDAAASPMCSATSRGHTSLTAPKVFTLPGSIWSVATLCSFAGQMDTALEFIALLTCAGWEKLRNPPPDKRNPRDARQSKNRNRFSLLCLVQRRGFFRFHRGAHPAQRPGNRDDPHQESRRGAPYLDYRYLRMMRLTRAL